MSLDEKYLDLTEDEIDNLLYGLDLDKHGLISCMFKDSITDLYEYTKWPEQDIYKQGFDKFKDSQLLLNDDPVIYNNGNNDNTSNFKNKLLPYYQNTFVRLVSLIIANIYHVMLASLSVIQASFYIAKIHFLVSLLLANHHMFV